MWGPFLFFFFFFPSLPLGSATRESLADTEAEAGSGMPGAGRGLRVTFSQGQSKNSITTGTEEQVVSDDSKNVVWSLCLALHRGIAHCIACIARVASLRWPASDLAHRGL